MSTLTEVVTELNAMTDLGLAWGMVLSRSAADWDMWVTRDQDPYRIVNRLGRRFDERFPPIEPRRDPVRSLARVVLSPEMVYYRDSRALELLGRIRPTVERLTYANPLDLSYFGSGLLLAGVIMAARLVRDWSSERRIGEAEARKATAEARVAETWADREEAITASAQRWLTNEAERTSTPLPIGEMTAITAGNDFSSLRRLKNRSIELTGPDRWHPHPSPASQQDNAPEQEPPDQKT